MSDVRASVLTEIWSALSEDVSLLSCVDPGGYPPGLRSNLDVGGLVRDSIAAASLAAAKLTTDRPSVSLNANRVYTAVTSERHFRLNGVPPNPWADLSGFWEAADGWVRTHANYPHHRTKLCLALGLSPMADHDRVLERIRSCTADEIESRAAEVGAVAVRVRSADEWRAGDPARAVAATPLVTLAPGLIGANRRPRRRSFSDRSASQRHPRVRSHQSHRRTGRDSNARPARC